MTRFLIFLFPAMIDMVLGLTFFVASVRIAESGGRPVAVTMVTATWAAIYMISSQGAGRIARVQNSARLILTGCALLAVGSLALIAIPNLNATYPIMMLTALGTALFFTPFQVFMKAVDRGDNGALPRSVGLYTFSWSAGMAAGPFVSAFVWGRFGWPACYMLSIALCAATALGIVFLKHHAGESRAPAEQPPTDRVRPKRRPPVDYSGQPDLAWLGWLCARAGCLTVAALRSYLPSSATVMGIPRMSQGILLALISGSQALTGLVLCRSRLWMYKALPVLLFGTCGVVALLMFSFSGEFLPLALASALFGIYSGSFFFYLVFHSLVHPEHSTRYVAINESVVGLTSLLGPLAAGLLATGFSIDTPYRVSALLILMVVVFQAAATRRHRRP
ncbi:MAG: MFS transporter [Kiritimatiellales bacterium]|nr:MFS transporter [Kiritimatiellales bacterium]